MFRRGQGPQIHLGKTGSVGIGARVRRGISAVAAFGPEVVEHGHADGDAVFDLVVDKRAFVVHDRVTEFDAAVHGAGVHDVEAAVADLGQAGLGDAHE